MQGFQFYIDHLIRVVSFDLDHPGIFWNDPIDVARRWKPCPMRWDQGKSAWGKHQAKWNPNPLKSLYPSRR